MGTDTNRINTLDSLRGLASLAVLWYHCTHFFFAPGTLLNALGEYGQYGVHAFFVISGFVLPYAMHRASYGPRQYHRFIAKRLVRLEPPYLCSIGLVFALAAISSIHGPKVTVDWVRLLLHFGYLNAYFDGHAWYNPVFWTLAAEFKFYLAIGLIYPAIASERRQVRWLGLTILAAFSHSPLGGWLVGDSIFLFMAGIAVFQYRAGLSSNAEFRTIFCLSLIPVWSCHGGTAAIVILLTSGAIAKVRFGGRILGFLGAISYSLYLVHWPLVLKVLQHQQWVPGSGIFHGVGLCIVATILSIFMAYALWWMVERPAQTWSSNIKYRP
jgi:peptidoglycan/LPS O-acetylase OafA/YrhL